MKLTPQQQRTAIDALQIAARNYHNDAAFYRGTGLPGHAQMSREKGIAATQLWQLIVNLGDPA